jgi:hypothetical protein
VVTFDASESFVFDSDTGGVDPDGITSVLWDFEDDGTVDAVGTRAEAIVANRVFQTPGIHRVRLTVRGGNSGPAGSIGEDSYVQEVSVGAAVETLRGLTVTKTGTGSGAIQSDPPGILRCDDTCTTVGPVLIEEGASVTLVATPSVGSSSSFGAWTGPCQGPLSSNVCPVTLDADRSVIGSFVGLAVTATAAPSRIDAGQSAQLSASVVGGTPPFSYDWLPASTLSAFDVANPTATPSNTTSYRVRVTDALGSFATSQVTVNVNLVVTATATPATIPFGGSSQLDVSIVGGSGPLTYSWSPAISLSDATRRNPVAAPLVSTQYNVVVTDGFGDVGVASVDVTVGNVGLSACITQVPIAPEAVRIDASCSLGNIVEYRYWADFRFEGQLPYEISTSPLSRILAYELSGTKLLRLEVRDTAGNISTATSLFVVP